MDEGRPKNTEKNPAKRNRKTHKRGPPGLRVLPGTEAATEPDSRTGQSGRSDERPRARSPSAVVRGRPVVLVVQDRPRTVAGGSSTLGSATEARAGPTRRSQTRPAARAAVETRASSRSRSTGPSRSHPSSRPTTPPASTPAGSSVHRGLTDEEPVHRAYPPGYRSAIFPPEEQLVEERAQRRREEEQAQREREHRIRAEERRVPEHGGMSADEDEELTGTVYHPDSDYPMVSASSDLGDGPGLATSDAEDSPDEGPSRPSTSFDRKGKAVDRPSSQWPGLGLEFDVPQRSSSVPDEEQLPTDAQDEEDFDIPPPLKGMDVQLSSCFSLC